MGTPKIPGQPAGTYARRILDRLLTDLSWNSSRLEGNTFRMGHRTELRQVVGDVVRGGMDKQATAHISSWTREHIDARDGERFREITERELLSLRERNFALYRVTPSEFKTWRKAWNR